MLIHESARFHMFSSFFSPFSRLPALQEQNSLDSMWEKDISRMSYTLIRAAIRYTLKEVLEWFHNEKDKEGADSMQDLTFITGIPRPRLEDPTKAVEVDFEPGSKKELALRMLSEQTPSLDPQAPSFTPGSIFVPKEALKLWLEAQGSRDIEGGDDPPNLTSSPAPLPYKKKAGQKTPTK